MPCLPTGIHQLRHNGWCLQPAVQLWMDTELAGFSPAAFISKLAKVTRLEVR